MPVTILDLVVIGVVLISALLAAVRGFTREVLAIVSWIAAAAVAWMFHPQLVPFIQQYIPASSAQPTIALVASIAALFLGTLIVVSLVTARISDFVLDSRIGALDRTLGFVFGAARGLLLAVIGYLFFAALVGNEKMPVWAKEAKAKPMLEETGRSLIAMLPQDVNADFIKNLLKKQAAEPATEAPAEEPRTPATPAPVAPAPSRP
ncbi:MAG: CvpA family protein [Bosea sp. (in: a-proteobacteria)]|uniref:CvpA family protein n=1 Tax=unclassified Bosea (in: a-proteobacteria) TaxID=2653178 RepID=UPI0009629A40|nr:MULTISPECIES: CvpA family protein [unclassified Bosea (in: a-proteobacteria)]MBN9441458.1 CvpA family protein [Bosea sp. (in: a-proteobacteria)]MBN9457146.1 CvpA family protein [Bosea sp. (in: a-proteobacteria)]OJV09837.1 MAG: colicin V synthesis protein [Bosea sp. 67-29]